MTRGHCLLCHIVLLRRREAVSLCNSVIELLLVILSHVVCLQELRRAQGHVRGRCRPDQAQDARERMAGDQGESLELLVIKEANILIKEKRLRIFFIT